jgi:hypothetical protein
MFVDLVAEKIARRYAHPERKAYTYLFRLKPDRDFNAIVPEASSVTSAWVDEGNGLLSSPIDSAVEHCQKVYEARLVRSRPQNSQERRRQMARSIQFTVTQPSEDQIEVHLISRAIAFSPKGDREVTEFWRRTADGDWYSAHRPE